MYSMCLIEYEYEHELMDSQKVQLHVIKECNKDGKDIGARMHEHLSCRVVHWYFFNLNFLWFCLAESLAVNSY